MLDCTQPFIVDIFTDALTDAGDTATPNTAQSRGKNVHAPPFSGIVMQSMNEVYNTSLNWPHEAQILDATFSFWWSKICKPPASFSMTSATW